MADNAPFKVLRDEGSVETIRLNGGKIVPSKTTYEANGKAKHRYKVTFRSETTHGLFKDVTAFVSNKIEKEEYPYTKLILAQFPDDEDQEPRWILCSDGGFERTEAEEFIAPAEEAD